MKRRIVWVAVAVCLMVVALSAAAGAEDLQNLARAGVAGATVQVDSCYQLYTPKSINDGERNDKSEVGRWADVAWASFEYEDNHWVEIDWPTAHTFSQVDIYWARDTGKFWRSTEWILQYWDGKAWKDLYHEKLADGTYDVPMDSVKFAPVTTDKIRLFQPVGGGPKNRPDIMWIAEIEAYGK